MERKQVLLAAAGAGLGLATWAALSRRNSAYDLTGKVVLITGGSRGLGLQMAREFGSRHARVVICARDADELERARLDLHGLGVSVQAIVCNVTSQEQVSRMVAEATEQNGRIDILVNHAGVIQVGPVEEMTIADFENAMSTIFWGTLYSILAVLPQMRERRDGRIVNITSIGGKVSVPHLVPYSCAKFAAVALSEGLRAELAGDGIKVVTVVPGLMRTGSHLNAQFKGQHVREYAWFSLGAATPVVSISAERAARAVVESARRGDAEKILSVPADLLARLHGAIPELTQPILALVNRFMLPAGTGGASGVRAGHEADRELDSVLFSAATSPGRSAAERHNEVPVA